MTEKNILQAQATDTVSIHFTCRLKDGSIFDTSAGKEPLQFTIGSHQVMRGLEQALIGMRIEESKTVTIPAREAFGEYSEERKKAVERDSLPRDTNLIIGQSVDFRDETGLPQTAKIIGINGLHVVVDTNHPLAGKDLLFDIQLLDIVKPYRKNAQAYLSKGNFFARKGQLNKAIQYYEKALGSDPHFAPAYNNLGTALKDKGEILNAIACYKKALQIDPHDYLTYSNMGTAFESAGKLDEAISCYQKALSINPGFAGGHYNIGNAFSEEGKQKEALQCYEQALALNQEFFLARWAYCMELLPMVYDQESDIEKARVAYSVQLNKLHDGIALSTPQDIESAANTVGSHQPFFLACQPFNNRDLQERYGGLVCRIMEKRHPQFSSRIGMPPRTHEEPIRLGIVSKFFCWHSVWKIPVMGWIEHLDKKRFSIYGYHTGKVKDHTTETVRQRCTRFVEDIYSFEELCQLIRDDTLHVLIYPEIGMDPTSLRLAALRLAPVQCTSLGHPETSGLPTIDYYLSSDLMEPSGADAHYTETLVRLPNVGFSYIPFDIPTEEKPGGTFGLRPASLIYLCSHALFTHLPQYDYVYSHIAKQVDDCQFVFISHRSRYATEHFHARIRQAFQREGLGADSHVVILPRLSQEQYSALHGAADIFLDTIGWSANNSTFEAIACDLPVVTFPGKLMRQRHCAGILEMMGMTETIASSVEEYIGLAIRLGKDAEWRLTLSEKIAANKHRLYHDKRCIAALENFLEKAVDGKSAEGK